VEALLRSLGQYNLLTHSDPVSIQSPTIAVEIGGAALGQ
jgi:hypothetical protein